MNPGIGEDVLAKLDKFAETLSFCTTVNGMNASPVGAHIVRRTIPSDFQHTLFEHSACSQTLNVRKTRISLPTRFLFPVHWRGATMAAHVHFSLATLFRLPAVDRLLSVINR